MIIYLTKLIFCSGLLVLFYFILFERERMHVLKRYYLLISLILSLLTPLISFELKPTFIYKPEQIILKSEFQESSFNTLQKIEPVLNESALGYIFLAIPIVYILISSALFFRLIKNLVFMLKKQKSGKIIQYQFAKLVLIENKILPHSFFQYIFLNQEDYENGTIEKEILEHELAHVKQKHTLDILIIEVIQALFWFNPFFFLIGKVIRLNHEYLADEAVINKFKNTTYYQQLLFSKASQSVNLALSSPFNYLIYKKRLTMMTKTTSASTRVIKQLLLLPLLATTLYFFSTQTIAQVGPASKPKVTKVELSEAKQNVVSQELMNEYQTIINKYSTPGKTPGAGFYKRLLQEDKTRLENIFTQMSEEQKAKQVVFFIPSPGPLKKNTLTYKQFTDFKNSKMYGVWLDGKRINNTVLNNYKPENLVLFFVSKLEKNAKNYGKHYYQVDLMTRDQYADYYKKASTDKSSLMAIRNFFADKKQ